MLKSVYIKNFALIREVRFDFKNGFTAVTGETGAGKSILFEALDFLLGKRSEAKVVREGAGKAVIEGEFNWDTPPVKEVLKAEGLDVEFPLIVRREIRSNGRSRAFVNDTPASNAILRQLAEDNLDIHSQLELPDLLKPSKQLGYVDDYGSYRGLFTDYKKCYKRWKESSSELELLKDREGKANLDLDYYTYLVDEIEQAQVQSGEEEDLEKKLNLSGHTEEIKKSLYEVSLVLSGEGEMAIVPALRNLTASLQKVRGYYKPIDEMGERLESTLIELEDIAAESDRLQEEVEFDPQEKEAVEERLDQINALFNKHNINSSEELAVKQSGLQEKIDSFHSAEEAIEKLEKKVEEGLKELNQAANQLTKNRKAAAQQFAEEVGAIIRDLGMPHARFEAHLTTGSQFGPQGKDHIDFYFNANKGAALRPLKDVASGGELARVMLGIKSMIGESNTLKTVIFDEIDAGVSGGIAYRFGKLFKQMGKSQQVISITHLPQVAALGDHHVHVEKKTEDESETGLRYLNREERIVETARLISTDKLSDAAMENARELLTN